ncbi:MAG TPA: DUF1858 domain-containing protein [candidate division Zixibacteria bacterium]|nr:DUF1858 domain-containing protein [candidate division Zixibacteria bacterium]
MDSGRKLDITPKTKVGELLNEYPHLEETLIDIAPAFKKLRNPILRKTIARVTSLRQAARVGNVGLGEMINRLRREAGLAEAPGLAADSSDEEAARPEWADDSRIADTIDARPLLDAGEQPLGKVMSALNKLEQNRILVLITPFIPAPIIDKAKEKGFRVWWFSSGTDEVNTYFMLSS